MDPRVGFSLSPLDTNDGFSLSGISCSKLTTSFIIKGFVTCLNVNITNTLLFLLKKCENLLHAKDSQFFLSKITMYLILSRHILKELTSKRRR